MGHHSTSDDSFAYRPRAEVDDRKRIDNPLTRFRLFMESNGWWNTEAETELKERLKRDVMKAFKRAESLPRCELKELFTDIYGGPEPWNIVSNLGVILQRVLLDKFYTLQREQREDLTRLLKKYGGIWEPWKTELEKFKNAGRDLLKHD